MRRFQEPCQADQGEVGEVGRGIPGTEFRLRGIIERGFGPVQGGRKDRRAMEKVPMTAAGHQALESELKRLMSVERPRIIELIAEARGHGDLSENAEYHAAKEAHGLNEGRIA